MRLVLSFFLICSFHFIQAQICNDVNNDGICDFSEFIHVDQFGYLEQGSKVAVISNPQIGFNAGQSFAPSGILEVRNAVTNGIVISGQPQIWNNGATHPFSGDQGWWFDFSQITTPGTYFIYDPGNQVRSCNFQISNNVYNDVLRSAMKMYYYNRCNATKVAPYAEPNWTDGMNFQQDLNCRYLLDQGNASLEKDLSGGWFDAGDYNKYVTFTHDALHDLLWAYEENPTLFGDDWNIPESGNGVPDILDEIKWELDFLLRMTNPDGSVHIKMGSLGDNINANSPPSANTEPRFYGPICSSAAISNASVFAHAASVFADIPSMNAYANVLETNAQNTFNYVLPALNSNTLDTLCDDGSIVAGDADWEIQTQRENAVVAAIHLFDITGNNTFHQYVLNNVNDTEQIGNNYWPASKTSVSTALLMYTSIPNNNNTLENNIINSATNMAANNGEGLFGFDNSDLYRAHSAEYMHGYGSNRNKAQLALQNLLWANYGINSGDEASYRMNAAEQVHYFHGVNPMGLVYLSNMYQFGADRCLNEVYHLWFNDQTIWDNALTSLYGPAPGFLAGGPNSFFSAPQVSPPFGQPDLKSYLDFNTGFPQRSWEVAEPGIYYQAAYVRLLASQVTDSTPNGNGISVVSCPSNITTTVTAATNQAIVTWNPPIATTDCAQGGLNITQIQGANSGSSLNPGNYVISYQISDACGNITACSFSISVAPAEGGGDCPTTIAGFSVIGELGNSKYFLSNSSTTPTDAQGIAAANGGYLAVISSQQENDFIQQGIDELTYIGLNDQATEGNLQWGNGEPVSFNNINPCAFCNDNDQNNDFVVMQPWNGAWSFANIWNQRRYVLEVPCDDGGGGNQLPDLTVSNVSNLPASGNINQVISFNVNLNNIGDAAVDGSFYVDNYISSDNIFSSDDVLAGFVQWSNTPAGNTVLIGTNFTVPNLPDGNYFLIVAVDLDGDVVESNENNNTTTIPFTISSDGGGGGECPTTIPGFSDIGEFGDSKYFLSNSTAIFADAQNIAAANGGHLATISSAQENDFIQQGIDELTYIGLNDQDVEGNLVWSNGEALTYNYINPCVFCNENDANNDYAVMQPWDGAWSFASFYNQRRFVLEVPCDDDGGGGNQLPDLTVSNLTNVPASGNANQVISINVDVNNIGNATAIDNYFLDCYISNDNIFSTDDALAGYAQLGNTPVGTTSGVPVDFTVPDYPDGNYFLIVFVDGEGTTVESNENNNTLTSAFTIGSDNGGGGCPNAIPGFTEIGEFGNSKYYVSNNSAIPVDAQNIAEANGGYLATISSAQENDFIQQGIDELTYIGLTDQDSEGNLQWFNGEPLTYNYISPCAFCNENDGNNDYTVMQPWDGAWSFASFYNQRKFVMEIPCNANFNNAYASLLAVPEKDKKPLLLHLTPNPAMNFIFTEINSSKSEVIEVLIYNASGVLVKKLSQNLTVGTNQMQLDIAELEAGFYTIYLPQANTKFATKRFVKVKD